MSAYLDNSATTRPTASVIEAMARSLGEEYFNPSSQYAPAVRAEKLLANCRAAVLSSVRGEGAACVFTSGGTEANNLAILGYAQALRGTPPVAVGATEHPSVLAAFEALEKAGHRVCRIPVTAEGEVDYDHMALPPDTALVSFMQVNNETGALLDCERFSAAVRAQAPGARVHIDGVQGFLRVPFDFRCCDLYTISAHKIHGPKGVGALLIKKGLTLRAQHIGGGQEGGLRAGTENTAGIAGLHQAVLEMDASGLMEKKLALYRAMLAAAPEVLVNGPAPEAGAPHILNLSFPGVRGEVLLHALEASEVYVSTGSACSSKKRKVSAVLLSMGLSADRAEAALRFSLSPHTTCDEIACAAAKIQEAYPLLRQFRRK